MRKYANQLQFGYSPVQTQRTPESLNSSAKPLPRKLTAPYSPLCSSLGRLLWLLHGSRLHLRSIPPPLRLHNRLHLHLAHGLRYDAQPGPKLHHQVRRPLPHHLRHLRRHARHHLLVQHEPRWPPPPRRRQRVAGRLREYRRHHCHVCVLAQGCPRVCARLFDFVVVSVISCSIYFVGCVMANRKRERTTDGTTTEYEKAELGDLSPDYRYIL